MDGTPVNEKLAVALSSIGWNEHVQGFLAEQDVTVSLTQGCLRLAVWAKQLETCDKGNLALPFVREVQADAQHVVALASLALYRPAASQMRAMVECALYYTYFRTHAVELDTLVRDDANYYVSRPELVEFHQRHTPQFNSLEQSVGLVSSLNTWYKRISAIAHGQLPGKWAGHASLANLKPSSDLLHEVVADFREAVEIVHHLFLCTVGQELWSDFSLDAKKKLLHGLTGKVKEQLNLPLA